MDRSKRGVVLHNPAAGRFGGSVLVRRAVDELIRLGWQIDVQRTRSGEHATELARQAADQVEVLFVAGGDGSLERAIRGLVGSRTALSVLPVGTANVWAQEIGLPIPGWLRWRAIVEAARLLDQARIRIVDVGYCDATPFLLWTGVGLDAFIVHSVEPRRRLRKLIGSAQYVLSGIPRASRWKGLDLIIRADGIMVEGHFLLGVMSNIRLYAGGLATLSPQARLDDGAMELWLFEGGSLREALRHVWDLWSGRHVESERVRHLQFRSLTLESSSPLYVQIDGEPLEVGRTVQVQIAPEQLRILVPPTAPDSLFGKTLP